MEEENKGITFKGICKTIWLKKWVALIVAVVCVLVCAISLFYGYNARVKNYVMEFSLNLPGDDNGVVYIYPNGSQLYYADMTSLPTLKAVKNSNESFSNIDVDDMATKGHINVVRNISVLADDNLSVSKYREITYTITAKASCFSSANQAKEFLAKIANVPVDYLENMTIDYGVYLDNFDKVDNYEKEIELLKNQLDMLTKGYASLISNYGDGIVVENSRTLYAYAHDVELYAESNELENLLTRVQSEKLLKNDETCKQSYELELIRVREQLEDATITLNKLTSTDKAYTDGASVIKAQQDLVNELTRRKELVEGFTKGTVNPDFENEIKKAYDAVKTLTESYSSTSETVYSNASSVVYIQPGIIEVTGGMGLTKIVLLSGIVGVAVALIAAYVAGYLSLKKAKTNDEAPSTTAQEEQLQIEVETSENDNKE